MRDKTVERITHIALELRGKAHTLSYIADKLNKDGFDTPQNNTWTADNLRKFLQKHSASEDQSSDQADGGT